MSPLCHRDLGKLREVGVHLSQWAPSAWSQLPTARKHGPWRMESLSQQHLPGPVSAEGGAQGPTMPQAATRAGSR